MHSNEKVLRTALDAIAARDPVAFAEVVADDMVLHVPGRSRLAGDPRGRGAASAGLIAETAPSAISLWRRS
jgi:ketosteroid isomerase-like protein